MYIAIDAVGIRGHGGAAVLTEILHWLPIVRPKWRLHVFLLERRSREFDDPLVSGNVKFEHITLGNYSIGRLWWVYRVLPARIQNLKADVLFCVANIAPTKFQVPQVVLCHQPNAFFSGALSKRSLFKRLRLRFMRRQILQGALASQAMIVQTHAMRERIEYYESRLKGKIHVVPSGYRTPSEHPCIRSEKKTKIDNASNPRLIYVSHPGGSKNHLALVQAMPLILEDFPSANLLLTLERHHPPNSNYSTFVDEICRHADQLGVSEHLIWVGILNPDEVDYALRSCDLMVFPSLSESFGLGLVEAMAAGCPVATADLPYAHDVCGAAAVYFNPYDPDDIAGKIVNVLRDKNMLNRLINSGKKKRQLYSYQNIAEKISKVLEAARE